MKQRLFLIATGGLFLTGQAFGGGSFAQDSVWGDGRAEVAVYDTVRVFDGQPRSFKEHLLVAQEDLNPDTLDTNPTDKKQKGIRVLKFSQVQRFDTENFPYGFTTSVYVNEKNPRQVIKMTVSSQEWGGNAFKIYRMKGDSGGELTWYGHMEGDADGVATLEIGANDYFADQLAISLRDFPFQIGTEQKVKLWDSLVTNRALKPGFVEATIRVASEELVRSRAGALPCWKIEVVKPGATDTYWFEKKGVHILVKMETADGQSRLLYGRARWSYWDRRLPRPKILN